MIKRISGRETKWEIENCILTGKSDYVNAKIEEILSTLELPVDFSVDFNFKESDIIEVDLDLPEIDDLPNKKANLLSSGKLSVKEKNKETDPSRLCYMRSWTCFLFSRTILQY